MPFAVCLLKERKGSIITTKCGREKGVVPQDVTVWTPDVTCPKCLALMGPPKKTRRLVRKKQQA